ncbi:glycoside hydrolase superfamily [Tribonema minus]|uniref:Glycoside hydrolase superfamily n=1 Tax=Tribonema minus TaxID=303371 RepID=A0A836CK16_9STRA|nr:glycoside hydrolase superfamily [Tribonema minus]
MRRRTLDPVEAGAPYHVTANVWLAPNSACALAIDNSLCPYLAVTTDDPASGGGNLLVGGGNLVTAQAGAWNVISGVFFMTPEQALGTLRLEITHLTQGEAVCVDDVAVVRSTLEDFRPASDAAIDALRKRDVQLNIGQTGGVAEPVHIAQTRRAFPIGSVLNPGTMIDPVNGPQYKAFFSKYFNYCADEYAMVTAWETFINDKLPFDHTVVNFCDTLDMPTRGHTIMGELSDTFNGGWDVFTTPMDGTMQAQLHERVLLWMGQYKDRVVDIEPLNEMLNSRLWPKILPCDGVGPCICDYAPACPDDIFPVKEGVSVHAWAFKLAASLAPADRLVVNEYCVTGFCQPEQSNLSSFVKFVKNLNVETGGAVTGVADQGHYNLGANTAGPDTLLKLASIKEQLGADMDLWISEFDLDDPDPISKADGYEHALRAFFASPAVSGIVLWGFWQGAQWRKDAYLVNQGERLFGINGLLTKQWMTTVDAVVGTPYTVYYGAGGRCQAQFEVPVGAAPIAITPAGWKCTAGLPPVPAV